VTLPALLGKSCLGALLAGVQLRVVGAAARKPFLPFVWMILSMMEIKHLPEPMVDTLLAMKVTR